LHQAKSHVLPTSFGRIAIAPVRHEVSHLVIGVVP